MTEYGNLFVVAAPSGTGKTTLVKVLQEECSGIAVSISHTTRSKRPNEEDGINYFFVRDEDFQHMAERGDFIEHATVFGCSYGTSHLFVEEMLKKGKDVILEIDWQGMQQVKALFPDSISIFILPPSLENLHGRLLKRNQDKPRVIQERMSDVKETVSHVHEFDYIIINDEFSHALRDLTLVVQASRLRRHRQIRKYARLIQELAD